MSTTRSIAVDLDVTVTGGVVSGVKERGLLHWRGIPFAAPPVGDLRLRSPHPVEPWEGVRDASRFGPISHQVRIMPSTSRAPQSEDCLSINVIAPDSEPHTARPVMVFIHGGAYTAGSS